MIIREFRPDDFHEVEDLWKETGVFRPDRGDDCSTILRCNETGGKFLVLEDENLSRIIGTSWLTWDGRRLHLQYFAVLPSMQGRGYGRQLAEASLAFATTRMAPVKLEVHRNNIQAIQLYLNMGFKVLEGYEVYRVHTEK